MKIQNSEFDICNSDSIRNQLRFGYGHPCTPVGLVAQRIAIRARGLGFDFLAGLIGRSYPVHMSNLNGL